MAEQRLAKERVVECGKDAGSTVNPSAIGLPDQAFPSEVRIFDHSMPKMQSMKGRNLKTSIITSIVGPRTLWST